MTQDKPTIEDAAWGLYPYNDGTVARNIIHDSGNRKRYEGFIEGAKFAASLHQWGGWTRVEDGLPELPPPYIEDGAKITPITSRCIVYDGESVYEESYDEDGFNNHYITHWMPLPTKPNL
jgi:hypothetical protein